jgi:hypothetical protein
MNSSKYELIVGIRRSTFVEDVLVVVMKGNSMSNAEVPLMDILPVVYTLNTDVVKYHDIYLKGYSRIDDCCSFVFIGVKGN